MSEVTDEGSGSLAEATQGFISTMGVDEPSEEITEESAEESEELEAEQTEDSEEVFEESEEFETEESVEAHKYFLPIGEDGSDVEIAQDDVKNYIQNNGGRDYFGNSVSSNSKPNIGAYNGN